MPTLYIAGESAGVKNRLREFNMPMSAAAAATSVRNGIMMRVNKTVSSSFSGTAEYAPASVRVSGSAKIMPAITISPVATISALSN